MGCNASQSKGASQPLSPKEKPVWSTVGSNSTILSVPSCSSHWSSGTDIVSWDFHERYLVGPRAQQGHFGHVRGQVRKATNIQYSGEFFEDFDNQAKARAAPSRAETPDRLPWSPERSLSTNQWGQSLSALSVSASSISEKSIAQSFHPSMQSLSKQFSTLSLPNPSTPQEVMVKLIDMKRGSARLTAHVNAEVSMWKLVGQHKNCVQLYNAYGVNKPGLCYIVFERCPYSLLNFLEDSHEINERSIGDVFFQILTGLCHVHSYKVVHGDIKPSNFRVGGTDGRCDTIKLCDLGLSSKMPANGGKLTKKCPSVLFAAPEVILGTGHNEKADIWAFGVTVYCLLYGSFPYRPNETKPEKGIVTPKFKAKGVRSEGAVAFTKDLLSWAADQRPSAKEAQRQYTYMDAVGRGCHELPNNGVFPSLRNVLYDAKNNGVFQAKPKQEEDNDEEREYIDSLINQAQVQMHGKPLPDPEPDAQVTEAAKTKGRFRSLRRGNSRAERFMAACSFSSKSSEEFHAPTPAELIKLDFRRSRGSSSQSLPNPDSDEEDEPNSATSQKPEKMALMTERVDEDEDEDDDVVECMEEQVAEQTQCKDITVRERLEREMQEAADARDYVRAAKWQMEINRMDDLNVESCQETTSTTRPSCCDLDALSENVLKELDSGDLIRQIAAARLKLADVRMANQDDADSTAEDEEEGTWSINI